MPMDQAAEIGDVFCTLTGNSQVLREEHFLKMKDGAILCNSGHFNVEIDIPRLEKIAKKVTRNVRELVDEFVLPNQKKVYLIAEGRLVNLSTAEGHPASVMDMSFSVQALTCEYTVKHARELSPRVYDVPTSIDEWVSRLKLQTMGVQIDELTEAQKKYLASWNEGT
jgi:adenosylhomocysteinase